MATIKKPRENKDGSLSYAISVSNGYDENGKQNRYNTTYCSPKGTPEKEAEAQAKSIANTLEKRIKPKAENKKQKATKRQLKFGKIVELWKANEIMKINIKDKYAMKESTLYKMKSRIDRTVKQLGNLYLWEIDEAGLQKFVSYIGLQCRLSESSQKKYLSFVMMILRFAKRNGMIQKLPSIENIEYYGIGKKKREEDKYYMFSELEEIRKALLEKAPLKYQVFFFIAMDTGLRRGEILALEYDDINFETGMISITKTLNYTEKKGKYLDTPKSYAGIRQVYLADADLALVKELKKEQAKLARVKGKTNFRPKCLFADENGEYMHPNTPYGWFERFCKRNQLSFKDIHAFRHTYISAGLLHGIDPKELIKLVGHADESSLDSYKHELENKNRQTGMAIANFISNPGAYKRSIFLDGRKK